MAHDTITIDAGPGGSAGDPGTGHSVAHYRDLPRPSSGAAGADGIRVIPPSIIKAICRVQSAMEAVKRDGKNVHGNYAFASTDAVYAALTLKLAEAGLSILCLEEQPPEIKRVESKDGKTVQWGHFVFSFLFATADATWTDPRLRRTIYLLITGPQSFMSAQSYAEKALLRSVFKIATGDIDLDAMPQADTEEAQAALLGAGRKRKSSAAAKREGGPEQFNAIRGAIANAATLEDLRDIKIEHAEMIAEFPEKWATLIDDEFAVRSDDIRARMA